MISQEKDCIGSGLKAGGSASELKVSENVQSDVFYFLTNHCAALGVSKNNKHTVKSHEQLRFS